MAKFAKISIDTKKVFGHIVSAILKGDDKVSFNLNPPNGLKENTPDYYNDTMSIWINESKYD